MKDILLVAILVKNKSKELPLFLECLLNQTVDKKKLCLYIRSNDNTDNSIEILEEWLGLHGDKYYNVVKNYEDINSNIKKYKAHEWSEERYRLLGEIRNSSIKYAMENDYDYIVIDSDNFLKPSVIKSLWEMNLEGVVGPYLKLPNYESEFFKGKTYGPLYSNYHHKTDINGYFKNDDMYYKIFNQEIKGKIRVDVIHCTYLIPHSVLKYISYVEGKYHTMVNNSYYRMEYVVFSSRLREVGIPQYIDNEEVGGLLVLLDEGESLDLTYDDILLCE